MKTGREAMSFSEFAEVNPEQPLGVGWRYGAVVSLIAIIGLGAKPILSGNPLAAIFAGVMGIIWLICVGVCRNIPKHRLQRDYLRYLMRVSDDDREHLLASDLDDGTHSLVREFQEISERNASFSTFKSVRSKPYSAGNDWGDF